MKIDPNDDLYNYLTTYSTIIPRRLTCPQFDPEASVHTNRCILIGLLSPSFCYNTKCKFSFSVVHQHHRVHVLAPGINAFMATADGHA
ncbi:hypothetical protein BDR05DRAFT_966794, partial [Suillus weaverae]